MRWQISTRCLGVSGCVGPAALEPFVPDTPLPVVTVAVLELALFEVDLLPLPHPARSAPPTSARTRHVDTFRIDASFLRRTLARPLPVARQPSYRPAPPGPPAGYAGKHGHSAVCAG